MTVGMIKDFHCGYDNFTGISADIVRGLDLQFPDAYVQSEPMARLAQAVKRHLNAAFCCLPSAVLPHHRRRRHGRKGCLR